MANSFVRYTGNNSTTSYSIPFSYRKKALFENKAKKYNEHYKTLENLANN